MARHGQIDPVANTKRIIPYVPVHFPDIDPWREYDKSWVACDMEAEYPRTTNDGQIFGECLWEHHFDWPDVINGRVTGGPTLARGTFVWIAGAGTGALSFGANHQGFVGAVPIGAYGFYGPHPTFNAWIPYNDGIVPGPNAHSSMPQTMLDSQSERIQHQFAAPFRYEGDWRGYYFDISQCDNGDDRKRTRKGK